jgi:hypothetical protein
MWKASAKFDPSITAELLLGAARDLVDTKPTLLVDGGVENYNSAVDELVETGLLRRLLAMTDVSYSNSLIESWWRSLKHQWLFLNTLDTISKLTNLVVFYVNQHNTHLPHSAFRGQTPNEMYFGTGGHVPDKLNANMKSARQARMTMNRLTTCSTCQPLVAIASRSAVQWSVRC